VVKLAQDEAITILVETKTFEMIGNELDALAHFEFDKVLGKQVLIGWVFSSFFFLYNPYDALITFFLGVMVVKIIVSPLSTLFVDIDYKFQICLLLQFGLGLSKLIVIF
jgi:hypothetical protein